MSEREEMLKAMQHLTEAVKELTVAMKAKPAAAPAGVAGGLTVPFGRAKGQPIASAPSGDLKWVGEKVFAELDIPEKEKWREKNLEVLKAINAALSARGEQGFALGAPGEADIPF